MSRGTGEKGKVWLAGAGPGDAGLLTVKTKELLESADVIVYDALVSPEIISQIPNQTKMIYVGKRSGNHPVPQDEINQILLTEAQAGRQVLRLKGGDPFVFGRGGEELELLVAAGIPFEIIPGITSAAAVPAYAGIPVTHRDFTSSFHIITGHHRKDGSSRIDYPALVKMDATLVFLMGITAMPDICSGLMNAGMDPHMPAAVLEKGTTAQQRRVISTVGQLQRDAAAAKIETPAIILVGRVCSLAETFHWAEDRVLGGRQILITRPQHSSSRLAAKLRKLGAQVIELPTIETRALKMKETFDKVLDHFGNDGGEAWMVFTSPVGVNVFFAQMRQRKQDIRILFQSQAKVKFAAIGTATATTLAQYGLQADLIPAKYCAEALGQELAAAAIPGSQIVIMRAREASAELLPPLKAAGMMVEDVPIYETIYKAHDQIREKIEGLYRNNEIDMTTFTSASTVRGFIRTMEGMDWSGIKAICIGEQTAAEAKAHGMQPVIANEATIDSMVDKIVELCK